MEAVENLSMLALVAARPRPLAWLSVVNSVSTLGKTVLFIVGRCGRVVLLAAVILGRVRRSGAPDRRL